MWTKTFWILSAAIFLAIWSTFAFFSIQTSDSKYIDSAPKMWDISGNFSYTGANISDIETNKSTFTGSGQIDSIRQFISEKNFSPNIYIEYPNFSGIQNVEILSEMRKNIIQIAEKNATSSGNIIGYSAIFSLKNGNTNNSIDYTLHAQNDTNVIPIAKKIFHISDNGKFIDNKKFLNTERTLELANVITDEFLKKFANEKNKKILENIRNRDMIATNTKNSLENPELTFSGSEIIFYLPSDNFYIEKNIFENFETIKIPYETVKYFVIIKPKIEEKIKPTTPWVASDGKKYVALTFDDGPGRYTDELLNILKQKNVPATFYVLGKNVSGNEAIMQKMHANGHEIGSHSWDHASFTKLSPANIRSQIEKTDLAIQNAIGVSTKTFRPPYGAFNPMVTKNVNKSIIMWSVDSFDWKNRNVEKNISTTMKQVHDGAIILYHDIHKPSVDTISPLIDRLRAEWYEFLTVSDLYKKYYNENSLLPEQVCYSMKRC